VLTQCHMSNESHEHVVMSKTFGIKLQRFTVNKKETELRSINYLKILSY
jgi:hypothetical protein